MFNIRFILLSTTLFLIALLAFAACKYAAKKDQPSSNPVTKTDPAMPEPNPTVSGDYAEDWKIVDSLERQGLFKSAQEKTEAIQSRARADRNIPQVIKALLFRGKYATMLEEDGFVKAVQLFEAEEKIASPVEKAVLQSILGQLYSTYLDNQRWRIQNRTPIPDGEGGDILTWSTEQIEKRALDYYLRSVEPRAIVRETEVSYFRDILTPGQRDSIGRQPIHPTLYDLLTRRAIAFLSNERNYLTEPAYKFEIDDPAAFDPYERFVKLPFATLDTTSRKWLALKIFQRMKPLETATNVSHGNAPDKHMTDTATLIDVDLLRLQFVHNNYVGEDKDNLYLRALEYIHKQYYYEPSDAEIVYAMASLLVSTSSQPGHEQDIVRAVTECEDAIRRHPGTYGAELCANLLSSVRAPSLQVMTEQVYLPEKPMFASLSIKNTGKIWVKVVRVSNELDPLQGVQWNQRLSLLNAMPALQPHTWEVPDPKDYRLHRTEFALDPLPLGQYFVVVADNPDFLSEKGYVTFALFSCSNFAGLIYQENGNASRLVVSNRGSGSPVSGVKADFFRFEWNYQRNVNEKKLIGSSSTDVNGLASVDIPRDGWAKVRLSQGNDTLWLNDDVNNYRYERERTRRATQFFTDRALYRPGQTVYFKGVLLQYDADDKPRIAPNESVTVTFRDANEQEKSRLTLKSNAFGTFNGAFTAPTSGLTGTMSIHTEGAYEGQAYFNVEEYKRPKFEVTFRPAEGAFRLNEQVTVKGQAKAYAGSNVDGAAVSYRVVRRARFPFWDYGWGWRKIFPPFSMEEMEIANGKATTAADGSFEVKFTAIPDRSIAKKNQPVFDFSVYADVTDVNGETRSGESLISIGYSALQLSLVGIDSEIELDSLQKVTVRSTNLAGQPLNASGTITLQRLVEPKTFYLDRYWEKPDQRIINKSDWQRLFPDFAWQDEDDPTKWDRQDALLSTSFNTAASRTVDLRKTGLQPGFYQLIATTKDAFGETVELKKVIRIWTASQPSTRFYQPDAVVEKLAYEPGQTARLHFGGKPSPLHFFYLEEREGKSRNPRWLDASANPAVVDLSITEADRGGISALTFTTWKNRLFARKSLVVNVPWTDKDLTITYETFRDKLLPGQQEEWRLKISGPKKEKVAAEMVATLYDASLDQFLPHGWAGIGWPMRYGNAQWQGQSDFEAQNGETRYDVPRASGNFEERVFPDLNWFGFPMYGRQRYAAMAQRSQPGGAPMEEEAMSDAVVGGIVAAKPTNAAEKKKDGDGREMDEMAQNEAGNLQPVSATVPAPPKPTPPPAPRTNLNETVFFFPELRTDAEGNVILKFKMNEALTRWRFMAFAHTKDLQTALSSKEVVTQKELMILTNPPRYLRAGDQIEFAAKVSNLSQQALTGKATLHLLDAATLQPLEKQFGLTQTETPFSVAVGQSTPVSWKLNIPVDFTGAVTWRIFAEGGKVNDGEESTLPVVTNRMLVTETLPITVRGGQTKTFNFDNLKNDSKTLASERYTIEFTSNPAWYVVQSLPYLMEYPHECSEQMFSRFYANTLAASVTQKMPNIRRVFDRWKGTDAMKSNLAKNQELKSALLEETPWVLEAQSEEQQKQNIALLFDLNRMADERERALNTLSERQSGSGGWAWFPGGREDWYITQYILQGFGHLSHLGALDLKQDESSRVMTEKALEFCQQQASKRYREIEESVQQGKSKWEDDHLDGLLIHYLYARSFFAGPVDKPGREIAFFLEQAEQHWLGKGLYQEGMLALALQRAGRTAAAQKIVNSLRERALVKEELGMYWPFDWGMYWYQLPIETQSLMVEVFDEVAQDKKAVEELRIWLLKNKQTNRWESTKATAEAAYALLLHGDNWLANTKPVQVSLGGKSLKPGEYEPGTGYFKESWKGSEVKNSWSQIKVENPNTNIVWGAAYWQYFEDLDKITDFKKTPLTIVKQLFREENSPTGPVLKPIAEGAVLHPGDKIKVRIEIRVDRAMEYVHLKDMRAAGFEPVNILSAFKWQGGLGYYESTKDLATHFFIDYLPRGTFVFEYPMFVAHRGEMSNGIATIQCMYAPEFASHSAGIRVKVQ